MNDHVSSAPIEQVLQQTGALLRPVQGDSMMPLLDQRTDLVKVIPCGQRLKPHDLPLYRRPSGELVLHRIVKVRRNHYLIRGDNRIYYEKVPFDWVVGLAVGRLRNDEYFDFEGEAFDAYIKDVCTPKDSFAFRVRVLVRRLFPSVDQMKRSFPILRQRVCLLPVYYVWRLLRAALRRLGR